jgi:hypothetical protein
MFWEWSVQETKPPIKAPVSVRFPFSTPGDIGTVQHFRSATRFKHPSPRHPMSSFKLADSTRSAEREEWVVGSGFDSAQG